MSPKRCKRDSAQQGLHEAGKRRLALAQDQVEVVGHDDVGDHLDVAEGHALTEECHKPGAQLWREERLFALAAGAQVEKGSGQVRA